MTRTPGSKECGARRHAHRRGSTSCDEVDAEGPSPEALLAAYRTTGDRRLRNQVVEAHSWLAATIARGYTKASEPIDDLVQVACVGLVKAAERFDPSFEVPYKYFAAVTIRGEIRRHFRDTGWALRVPRRLQDLRYDVRAATDLLRERLSRAPTCAELASYLRVDVDQILDCLCAESNYRSLSIYQEGEELRGDRGVAETGYGTVDDIAAFGSLISGLPRRLRRIIEMRYLGQMLQSEIAAEMGVSQVQISRLLTRALARLRELHDAETPPSTLDGADVLATSVPNTAR
jgi:RNA polymerase sigma-B factor